MAYWSSRSEPRSNKIAKVTNSNSAHHESPQGPDETLEQGKHLFELCSPLNPTGAGRSPREGKHHIYIYDVSETPYIDLYTYIYIYVHIYVYIYVYIYICIYIHMHVCMHVYLYVYMLCMYEWMTECMYVCMYVCMYICIHIAIIIMYVCMYMHVTCILGCKY